MEFLILGDGAEERAWAEALDASPAHRVAAAFPGLPGRPELPGRGDLDAALAVVGLGAAIAGGDNDLRSEGLRRAAGAGLACIALHPPGPDAVPYDQVALSRFETRAVVVPDLPGRLHPAMVMIREAIEGRDPAVGGDGELRYERVVGPLEGGLRSHAFARVVDLIRALLGELSQVTATGNPSGLNNDPTEGLVALIRSESGCRAEIRLRRGRAPGEGRLEVVGDRGTLWLEHTPDWRGPARILARTGGGLVAQRMIVEGWDPHGAVLAALEDERAGRPARPNLLDGTRALEATGAVSRSLRRGRTIELHHGQATEAGNFKAIMTSIGCLLLVAALLILPVALAGPTLGLPQTIYLAYLIPPMLTLFVLIQLLRLGIRDVPPTSPPPPAGPEGGIAFEEPPPGQHPTDRPSA